MLCWTSCPSSPAEVMPHPVTILHTHCHCRLFLTKWIPFPIKSVTDGEPESSSSGIRTSKGWENSVGCRKALPQRAPLESVLLGTASWILLIHQQQQATNGSAFPSLPSQSQMAPGSCRVMYNVKPWRTTKLPFFHSSYAPHLII